MTASLSVQLTAVPKQYFAATNAYVLNRRTSFILLYIVEDGSDKSPRGVELLLTPSALLQFVEFGKALLASPQCSAIKLVGERREPPKWETLAQLGVSACVHAVSNDLVATDFYLLSPRVAASQVPTTAGMTQVTVPADPVISCGLNVWEFKSLVDEAAKILEASVRELGMPSAAAVRSEGGGS